MSKYDSLWKWIHDNGTDSFKLTYDEIERLQGFRSIILFSNTRKNYWNMASVSVRFP